MSQADRDKFADEVRKISTGIVQEFERRMGVETNALANFIANLRQQGDSAHMGLSALVSLMFAKGLITVDEFEAEIAKQAELERKLYEARLSELLGARISLR